MKNYRPLILVTLYTVMLFIPLIGVGQTKPTPWKTPRTLNVSAGQIQAGIFQSWKYGLTDNTEISAHPLWFFVNPRISIQHKWGDRTTFQLATQHSLSYPTPILRMIQKKGIGGIIAEDPTIEEIPHLVAVKNEIIASFPVLTTHFLSGNFGLTFPLKSQSPDKRTTIDLPVIYPRLAIYYSGYRLNSGINIQGPLSPNFGYMVAADVFWLPGAEQDFFLEHDGVIMWKTGERSWIDFGYKLTFGEYPFGTQWHLLPLLDFQWTW